MLARRHEHGPDFSRTPGYLLTCLKLLGFNTNAKLFSFSNQHAHHHVLDLLMHVVRGHHQQSQVRTRAFTLVCRDLIEKVLWLTRTSLSRNQASTTFHNYSFCNHSIHNLNSKQYRGRDLTPTQIPSWRVPGMLRMTDSIPADYFKH